MVFMVIMMVGLLGVGVRLRPLIRMVAFLFVLIFSVPAVAMQAISDGELSTIDAQGLFWTDKILGSELTGSNQYSTPFTFYRMGLDGELALNLNIAKLQMGCGGVNDFLSASAACDIDIDYASLMGRIGTSPGNPLSAFVLKRPYIELAIKNDNNPVQREVVGLKIGAASADGAISAGRAYSGTTSSPTINQENGASSSNSCQGTSTGAGALGCHSGINSVSGFLGAELSLTMGVHADITLLGAGLASLDSIGCTGRTTRTDDTCGTSRDDAVFTDIGGTRMQSLGLRSATLHLTDTEVNIFGACIWPICGTGLIDGVIDTLFGGATASLNANLRLVHKLIFDQTGDFFLSFQREPVAYPRYSKMTPIQELQANGTYSTAVDSCAIAAYQSARCSSAYSVPANTGWWLNAPSVKLLDIYNPLADLGDIEATSALALLAAPGYLIDQAEFAMSPAKNCYGSSRFC
jgi:hypothetical protein